MESIKKHSISGLIYRFLERILAQGVSALVTIVLARILLPSDYGVVSIVVIAINICNVFVSDGLSAALIQKKDSDQLDFSTVFWTSFVVSIFIYLIIFFLSPFLASFFDNESITSILRVMGIKVFFASFNSVQCAYISKHFLFKKFFLATLVGTIFSGAVGIATAYLGFGPWALVIQYLTNTVVDTFFLFLTVKWRPNFSFSFVRFRALFGFGWKVLIGGLLDATYEEFRSLAIGKRYSSESLAYYTKGKQFPQLIGNNISVTFTNVFFPIFSSVNDNKERLKQIVQRAQLLSTYIISPLLIGFAAISDTFIDVFLTSKWMPASIFIKLFALIFLLKPLRNIHKCVVKSLKRSDLDLWVNIIEKVLGVSLFLVTLNMGPIYIALSAFASYFVATILYMIFSSKLLGTNIAKTLLPVLLHLLLAVVACSPAFLINHFFDANSILKLFLELFYSTLVFFLISSIFRIPSFIYLKKLAKTIFARKKETK